MTSPLSDRRRRAGLAALLATAISVSPARSGDGPEDSPDEIAQIARISLIQKAWQQQVYSAIAQAWRRPRGVPSKVEVALEIELLPGCFVQRVTILHQSETPAFDASAASAVFMASPLPCVDPPAFAPILRSVFTPESLAH